MADVLWHQIRLIGPIRRAGKLQKLTTDRSHRRAPTSQSFHNPPNLGLLVDREPACGGRQGPKISTPRRLTAYFIAAILKEFGIFGEVIFQRPVRSPQQPQRLVEYPGSKARCMARVTSGATHPNPLVYPVAPASMKYGANRSAIAVQTEIAGLLGCCRESREKASRSFTAYLTPASFPAPANSNRSLSLSAARVYTSVAEHPVDLRLPENNRESRRH